MKTILPPVLGALLTVLSLPVRAQEAEILALSGASALEELDESEYERLESLLAAPVRINTASPSRLHACGLFSRFQVVSLLDYRQKNGDVLSISELALIDGFSKEKAEALAPFISLYSAAKAGQPARKHTRLELTLRGDCRDAGLGYAAKYRLSDETRGSLALTARQAATDRPGAPDTWSFNLTRAFRNRPGKVMLGDFNARFGQGLALWNGFSLGGLTTAASFARHPTGLSPAWSLSPDGPLRGVAADLGVRRMTWSAAAAFPGLRERMDGNPQAGITAFGALNATWTGRNAELSATAVLSPAGAPASMQASGGPASKLAADFRWTPGKLGYFAETALDLSHRALAASGGLIWSPAYQKKLSLVARHYPATFEDGLTGGVRAGSRCRGESGIAAGVQLPWLRATADLARFPAKEEVQARLLCILPLTIGRETSLTPRVSLRWKNGVLRQEYRIEAAHDGTPWQARLRADAVRCTSLAWLAYAEGGCKTEHFQAYARAGAFVADHWEDRIYVYERDVPGCFNVPARYGRGYSASLSGGIRWKRHRLYLRLGAVHYVTDKPDKKEGRVQYTLDL